MTNKKNQIKKERKNQKKLFNVANRIITYCKKNKINDLTNLKLQKLVFYVYALYLVKTGGKKKLFSEPIEAWPYGPVVQKLYFEMNKYGEKNISCTPNGNENDLNELEIEVINNILDKFGNFGTWQLADKTHEELPWYNAYQHDIDFSRNKIEPKYIYEYYLEKPIL